MNSLFILAVLAVLAYLLFFRKGGVGCCGGHTGSAPPHGKENGRGMNGDIVDLDKTQYSVEVPDAGPDKNTKHL